MKDIKVKIKKLYEDSKVPQYATEGSSGVDLYAYLDSYPQYTLNPNDSWLFPTGISMEIPVGYEGQVRPRSGLAVKYGITVLNTPGTIDADYRGEIKVCLFNTSNMPYTVHHGDRIAQMVFTKVEKAEFEEVDELQSTDRGDGGFGSTGVK
jgi:dUTP pyrophosphatase